MENKRSVGTRYEKIAGEYLESRGMRVVEYNFRSRQGEIDLIARDGRVLVFVEVKYRRNARTGYAEEAVSASKQRTICRVADFYRIKKRIPETVPCRFDVVAIQAGQLRYYRNAFEYQY